MIHLSTAYSAAFDATRTAARHAAEAALREETQAARRTPPRKTGIARLLVFLGLLGIGTHSVVNADGIGAANDPVAAAADSPQA